MDLSTRTIPHSGQGYALETTDDPDSLSAIIPGSTVVVVVCAGMGAGTAAAGGMATGVRVCSLKKSLALRPGSAFSVLLCILQLREPNKASTSRRAEILKNFFIVYLLSRIRAADKKKIVRWNLDPPLIYSNEPGTIPVDITCYIGT
jgi:hypothetical protein